MTWPMMPAPSPNASTLKSRTSRFSVALSQAVFALGALQVTAAVPDFEKPALQENVATLACLFPLLFANDPLSGDVGAPVHCVSAHTFGIQLT